VSSRPRPLKPLFLKFIDGHMLGLTGAKALERTGWTGKRPDVKAAKILAREDVKAEIAKRNAAIASKYAVSVDRIKRRLAAIALGDMRELYDENGRPRPIHELTADQAALLGAKKRDVITAAELLGRDIGMFRETHVHMGPDGKPLAPPVFNFGFGNGGPGAATNTRTEGS